MGWKGTSNADGGACWKLDDFGHSLTSVSEATVAVYRRDMAALAQWAHERGNDAPGQLTRRDLRRYLAWLRSEGYARRTMARKASSIRRYFRWACLAGLLETDPSVGLQAPAGDGRLPRVLRDDELTTLLDDPRPGIVDDPEPRRLRDDAVLELLYGSGLRVSELCGLRGSDVDLAQCLVRVTGKGDKERLVPLSPPSVVAIEAWQQRGRPALAGPDTNALFVNLRGRAMTPRDVRRVLDRRASAPVNPHALRHPHATH